MLDYAVGVMRAHVPSALPDGNRADAAANKDSCASVAVDSGVWVHVVLAVAPSGRPILSPGPRERAWSSATAGYWTVTSRGWRTLISRSDARLAGLVLEPQIVGSQLTGLIASQLATFPAVGVPDRDTC